MGVSYAYAVGNIRAREVKLLTRQDMEQLLAAGDISRLEAALLDKGFGAEKPGAFRERGEDNPVERLLRRETECLWDYLKSIAPDWSLFQPFLYRNDIHNAKTIIKGVLSDRDFRSLLLTPSVVDPAELERAVREKDYSALPPFPREAVQRAYEVLAHTNDAQLSDAVVDRAGMEAMLACAEDKRVPMLSRVVEMTVFYSDLKIALRRARLSGRSNGSGAYLKEALCPCPGLDLAQLTEAAQSGEKAILERMEAWDRWGSRKAAERYRQSPSAFERYVDDRLLEEALRGRTVTLGPEPLISYLLLRERELKNLHILFSGLRAGQEEAAIRGRLWEN